MHHFHYVNNELYCEDIPVSTVAGEVGTPFYIYSHATLLRHFSAFDQAFSDIKHLTCFSVKSNSNLAVLRLFAREGGGADIVSGGELFRALKAGVDPKKIVYSGVGKKAEEIEYALKSDILMFNVESEQELLKVNEVAKRIGKRARTAIRVNPDVDPKTHPYISTGLKENKFGVDINDAPEIYLAASKMRHIQVAGISCHIGSQLTETSPFIDAIRKLKKLIQILKDTGINIQYLDLGGGLGITYDKEKPPDPKEYASAIKDEPALSGLILIFEPGRVIVGNAGILVTKVIYTKATSQKRFFIVDSGMNDLMRPSLYNSFHAVQPVIVSNRQKVKADIVGPICESGDFFAKDREMDSFEPGDLIAVMSAGAYGFSMSSNYNSRPRPCEVMVKGDQLYIIRAGETYDDLVRGEVIPDFLMENQ